jgi:hypothetical protein
MPAVLSVCVSQKSDTGRKKSNQKLQFEEYLNLGKMIGSRDIYYRAISILEHRGEYLMSGDVRCRACRTVKGRQRTVLMHDEAVFF